MVSQTKGTYKMYQIWVILALKTNIKKVKTTEPLEYKGYGWKMNRRVILWFTVIRAYQHRNRS